MKQLLGGKFFKGVRWHDGHWWCSDLCTHEVLKITTDGVKTVAVTIDGCTAPSFAAHERKAANEAVLYTCQVDVPAAG